MLRGSWASTFPALCFREGCRPSTSCLACLVRIGDDERLVPSCATVAAEGMQVESETEAVHQVRRTALELLLERPLGRLPGPVPIRLPGARWTFPRCSGRLPPGELREAIATVKRDIALPAVLGRICPAPCEKVCRRGDLDAAVSICLLKRLVADVDLASRRAVRAGVPAGHGQARGDRRRGADGPVGRLLPAPVGPRLHALRRKPAARRPAAPRDHREPSCPATCSQAEVATITRLGIDAGDGHTDRAGRRQLADLRDRFDAVLLACGATAREQAAGWGLPVAQRGIRGASREPSRRACRACSPPAVRSAARRMVVRSVADGKEAAVAIDQFLCGLPVTGRAEPFSTKIGRMHGDELARFAAGATTRRAEPARQGSGVCAKQPAGRPGRLPTPKSPPSRPPAACTAIAAASTVVQAPQVRRACTMPIRGDSRPSGGRSSRMRSTPR